MERKTPGAAASTATEHVASPMERNTPGAAPSTATEHVAVSAESIMGMQDVVAEFSEIATDDSRELVRAAQIMLTGNQKDVRNLCHPWGVQLTEKKSKRPMEIIRQELKMALTQRAKKLKTEHEASHRDPAAEHTEVYAGADEALAETPNGSIATEHASAEFCIETAMDETPQNPVASTTSITAESMVELDPNANNYPSLFQAPGPELTNALRWARANAMQPNVADWLLACSKWDSAVATKENQNQKQRRKLCKETNIPCTRVVESNDDLGKTMDYIRQQLTK